MMLGTWWLSLANLSVSEWTFIWPRIVQVMGLGMVSVPLSTIMFRFLPTDQSSNAAGLYALVRNEGGSIGIAVASTFLQRTAQVHQNYLAANLTASNPLAQQAMHAVGAAQGISGPNQAMAGLAQLYSRLQEAGAAAGLHGPSTASSPTCSS